MADSFIMPLTLAHALRAKAEYMPDSTALYFLNDQGDGARQLSYYELDRQARTIAAVIQTMASPGDRAILLFPSGVDYVAAFFGCLYAKVIAVPAYPPESVRPQHQARLASIIEDARPRLLLTDSVLLKPLQEAGQHLLAKLGADAPEWLCVDTLDSVIAERWQKPNIDPGDIAFLQYTSGSTAQPKGVQVSHHNLVTNEWMIRQSFAIGDDDVIVSWLPLYHDMGLIGSLLQSIFSGIPCVLMSSNYFLERPVRWLEAISHYGGTISGGPDFAYRLCVERIGETALQQLNLSNWKVAFSGAEPIREDSLRLFSEKFSGCGFNSDKFFPCYGLAEATLFVTGGQRGRAPTLLEVDREALSRNHAVPGTGATLVGCGRHQPGQEIRIVEPVRQIGLADGVVGEIWTSGPGIANGYWCNAEATAKAFVNLDGRIWLRTGDLGFLREGELFITGRLKDMLIVRGHNLYPQDIERTIEEEVEVVRKGRVAAYAVNFNGEEGIGIAAEISRKLQRLVPAQVLIDSIRQVVAEVFQEVPQQVALLNPGTLPKTSSGKLQRSACRIGLADGSLDAYALYPAAQQQVIPDNQTTSGSDCGEMIRAIWCDILAVEHLAPNAHFFVNGGNSIRAVQMISALRERLGLSLDVWQLFEVPRLDAFSMMVSRQLAGNTPVINAIPPLASDQTEFACSPGQKRLWFLWQLNPRGAAYNIPGGLHLQGVLNKVALQQALQTLVERHEVLRTRFIERDGVPYQSVTGQQNVPVHPIDLTRLPIAEREKRAGQCREEEALAPFNLETGPLLRVTLIRLADDEHQLLVTFHHIIVDGWSANILMAELAQLYSAYNQGKTITLPMPAVTYGAYAEWQQQWLASEEAQQQRTYWLTQLAGTQALLPLPTRHPGEHINDRHSEPVLAARLCRKIGPSLAKSLRALADHNDTTLFMVLLAAFHVLLYRYSGEKTIRLGIPSANRHQPGIQQVVGFFVNTLVLQGEFEPRLAFTGMLAAVKANTLAAQAHQDLPFDQLSEALGVAFNVMFNHQQRDPAAACAIPGLAVEELPWHSRHAKCDLQLQSEEDNQGNLCLSWDYAESLFDADVIVRMAEHFQYLLQQIADDPQRAIADLSLLDAAGYRQLSTWEHVPGLGRSSTLLAGLEHAAALYPERIAIQWAGESIGYQQLHETANRLAHYLQHCGVGPDVCVGVLIERSPLMLSAILGILKAGGAYVPLDREYPIARLNDMLRNTGATLLLTSGAAPEGLSRAISIDLATLELANWPVTPPVVDLHDHHLAYVIHTSGSTGRPKAVGVSRGAMGERLAWMQATYALTSEDVLLQKAPLTFDVSVWECFWPLLAGARLVLPGVGDQRDPYRLLEWVIREHVSVLHFVPSLLQQFIEQPDAANCHSLRLLFSGGEVLSPALRDRVLDVLPQVTLHNRYGPTEAAINATYWQCQKDDTEFSPIGRPLSGTCCRVLDGEFAQVPPGVAGELCIGGAGLARGYLGSPAQTAQRFVPDPYADDTNAGARLYRSGDGALWHTDGALVFLGRLDRQVKLRGFRIEPGEIEARLCEMAGIRQAAVQVHTRANGDQQLLAYYTLEKGRGIAPDSLKQALKQVLPDYMVPAQLIPLDEMPLLSSGKVDYQGLPLPGWQRREYIAPVTPLEQQIAAIWQEVLSLPDIGLADDFFALGGHSLLATQIVARTRQRCNVTLPLKALFDASELRAFATVVARARQAGEINRQPPIETVDRHQPIPLSYSQQRLWFLWHLEPESPAYNVGGMARFNGALDVDALDLALQALIERHETLRTTFPEVDGVPVQQVRDRSDVRLARHDLAHLEPADRQARLAALADREAHQPFDLEQGPLLRAHSIRFSDQEHYLVLTLHHIVTEGWAMDIFARELALLYEAFAAGLPSPLAPLPVQYLDYSVWQRRWLESGERERQLDYWREQLGTEHPLLELPADRPRPAVQSHRGELYRFDLPDELAARVHAFNATRGTTLFMTVTAALALLLYRYSGQDDLRIGVPVANRIRPESEGLIGAFLNTQVLRCQVRAEMKVSELLDQVRRTVIEGQSHQDLPFEQVVDALQPQRSAAYNPLFQVMCNVQRWQFQQTRELAGMTVEYIVNDARAIKFDLNLEVTDLDGRLGCCLTYSRDLFDEPRIAAMADHWRNLLAAMIGDPQQAVASLPLFNSAEQAQLLACLNPSPVDAVSHSELIPVQDRFAQRAASAPEAIALIMDGETLCYGELERRANRLAHWLRAQGIQPEQRVGLALERSFEMVIGLLAILKSGAAYVPLDPEYPRERLHYIIEDSGIVMLLGYRALFDTMGELPAEVNRWCLEDDSVALAHYPDSAPASLTQPRHQAYLIYTSGSTGKPKGVVVDHGPLAMHCQAVIDTFGMRDDDCELHFYSINFDAASERLLTALLCGARVVLRRQGQWAVEEIASLIAEHKVTILGLTPGYGSQLAQWVMDHRAVKENAFSSVRLCITGGEALTPEHWQAMSRAFQPAYFFNAYGPTETVVMPLAAPVGDSVRQGTATLPIGKAVGERVAYILDDNLMPVPAGATGELYIGGLGVARGYHGRLDLTAERFIPNPFDIAGRLYRTGDLVRLNADGLAEYVGRGDNQVKIRGFRIELGEIESCLLGAPGVREAAVLAVGNEGHRQLVGYLSGQVLADETIDTFKARVKDYLQQQLPDYMVPAQLIVLDRLPLNPNGKLDRRALPAPEIAALTQAYTQPESDLERELADIWSKVLNVDSVGIDHNFFELGGDSILSIQVVSRARQRGIHFKPKDLFQYQTVRTLARVATLKTQASDGLALTVEQGPLAGPSPMTPIQHWFFTLNVPHPPHWNQAVWLDMSEPVKPVLLELALQRLIHHHDALRLRFDQQEGQWQAAYQASVDLNGAAQPLLQVVNVAQVTDASPDVDAVQRSLDLQQGPLLRGLLLQAKNGGQRLLLVIHHLVVDGVSWRILLEDLQLCYRQLHAGAEIHLPAKTTAFRDWAAYWSDYANSDAIPEALAWWQTELDFAGLSNGTQGDAIEVNPTAKKHALPCDFPAGENLEWQANTLTVCLDPDQTQALLQRAPAAYRTQVNDLLLTALARVLCRWTGDESVLVQLEGHGREYTEDILDLTRTVGWLTAAYPVRLTPDMGDRVASIKAVKEQLRSVQSRLQSYGPLRYLATGWVREAMAALPVPSLTFNYLGQIDQGIDQDGLFRWAGGAETGNRDPEAPLPNDISIDGQVQGGALVLRWTYSAARYRESTIAELAEDYIRELDTLIATCLVDTNGGLTPSDFPLAQLSQVQLDALPIPARHIEDIYPLTPMQEGLLLHTLLEPGTGIYYMQDRYCIDSAVDPACFASAWQAVVDRHEALRTSFSWNAGEAMVQIVHKTWPVPMDYQDWRGVSEADNEQRLRALLKTEREAGFDLLNAPPFHLRLIRIDEARYWFLMSNHHILIDAWCRSLLIGDFFAIYSALLEGRNLALPAAPRYRDYIAWLGSQDPALSRQWWRTALQGFGASTPIASDRPLLREHAGNNGGMQVGDCYSHLSAQASHQLQTLARQHQLTINTFAQAAWALVLRRLSGQRDVLFGVTVAGRPIHLPALQQTVGLFINSIPLRVGFPDIGEDCRVSNWLQHLQAHNLELRDHEHLPLVDIQACSEVPKGEPLFDSLFVFENAPVEVSVLDRARQFNASSDSGRTHTNFPLTAVCYPGEELGLHISFDQRYFNDATVEAMLGEFQRLLLALVQGFDGMLGDIPLVGSSEQDFLIHECNNSERNYPLESYVRLFEQQVSIHAESIVASCRGEQWQYRELNQYANRLGHRLLALGNLADKPVALLAERNLKLLGMILGTFKAGTAYLPLDPAHPLQRLADMLTMSRAPVLVCERSQVALGHDVLALCPEHNRPLLLVWEDTQHDAVPDHNPGIYGTANSLAYVIYTSGSTGKPKGVMVTQRGMLNNQLSKVPYLQLDERDVVAQTASQCFDISVWQFLAAPLFGGRVVIVPNDIAHHPTALMAQVVAERITVLESVPSLIQRMLEEDEQPLSGLRWMLPTGEAMPPLLAKRWLERYPDIGLVNAYGPAECSDDVAFFPVSESFTTGSYLPIGSPTDNNRLYVLNDELSLTPIGAVGELYVAGTGVGRGYLADPVRTARAFIPNIFGGIGERLYGTGDLARRRSDGLLEYVGRADHQVKMRGFRIELGEIESCLLDVEGVREAAVIVQARLSGDYLVAYLTPTQTFIASHSQSELIERCKSWLQACLPDYMVPAYWQLLAEMPRNTNGKLDRKALPTLDIGALQEQSYVAPRDTLEQQLAAIWADVLKIDKVGIHDNFFQLGGHSLLATQIASRVQKVLHKGIPLRAMFECHTVESLADFIRGLESSSITREKADRLSDLMAQLEV
ncbi:non-ribosomal peptide synthetase [Cellvibrio japonicus]|uniref:AMP-binding enzyme domain protein n=1 Tax=Cellvibrio japonicus (strain Ueda107) TaxID=498211 RepID=B3PGM7_CELJU|nr:non-ribosomal peptide synthetase [Cellvibrio japonicus]ACE85089.1 AMP-binding enzyme domain protein [Cellvibrio japonicus Ueda107]QEI12374.1 non-ribosomal peptide synthetase [Cellvibrio japonicus]QEI15947.1 non-ribosomal peptide synthetase [Cellvibrio japonicus]QEI19526.1 non-ribosomal peptide synthetase [Cellvibrio japonicus]